MLLPSEFWIEKSVKNQLVFMKIGETGSDRFNRFLVNWSVNLIFFNEIKILKQTRDDFKIFGQNRIQNIELT
jgi:hypothetical protein